MIIDCNPSHGKLALIEWRGKEGNTLVCSSNFKHSTLTVIWSDLMKVLLQPHLWSLWLRNIGKVVRRQNFKVTSECVPIYKNTLERDKT